MGTGFGRINRHLLLALAVGLAYHGSLLFYTFKRTYDAYVHIFFADHYARAWFDHWEYRWYTGFTMTSYPPGSHQTIALISRFIGLQNGFIVVQTAAILLVIIGIYRFSRLWVSEEAAGYAALVTVFSSSLTETMHVFGQLPTTFSLAFLLNALPFVYAWLRDGRVRWLLVAWAVNAATTAGHHVTTLFGAVFFVAPVMALAIAERLITPLPDEIPPNPTVITRRNARPLLLRYVRRCLPVVLRAGLYGVGLIAILLTVVLPYWLWSRADPITQVPIPHASRDSFIANPAAGLVFWLVPWGVALLLLPYAVYKGLTTRAWPLTLSLLLLFVLGTGGTTPIPRLLLRGAYDILTLDRFTFWATILVLPLLGEFVASLRHGRLNQYVTEQFGRFTTLTLQSGLIVTTIAVSIFIANLTQFRRFQPEPIDMQPIVNFIEKDQHWRWRYLPLGFGDQMAWLSAQTTATTVDGNYHSARRLPELTTTPVERLEGAKFRGLPGLGSLQQFLAVPEKYNLKFVFSNDAFYDPLLYFSGWHQLGRLENGIVVWEREDIPPLPEVLPRREIPLTQRALWGLVPITALLLGSTALLGAGLPPLFGRTHPYRRLLRRAHRAWAAVDQRLLRLSALPAADASAPVRWMPWLIRIRGFTLPRPAPPRARHVRLALLLVAVLIGSAVPAAAWQRQARTPQAVVIAYYDDLDFRRFDRAYARLDPLTRPGLEQFRLELSVNGGLLASYAKLDGVQVTVDALEADFARVTATTDWVTALTRYRTVQPHDLLRRDGRWVLVPAVADVTQPPDQFYRQPTVAWRIQEKRRVSADTTAFGDVQDRPELAVLSARLVQHDGRLSVVGELVNRDVDPGDVTVTAYLFDSAGVPLTWYNAQAAIVHKILPKEITPFRIDFEGVAGAAVADSATPDGDFDPTAFTPVDLGDAVAAYDVYAKAVVTGRDLYRAVGAQGLRVTPDGDGWRLSGELINGGTLEAVIPHLLLTYYAADGSVAWVDHFFLDASLRPQRTRPFSVALTPAAAVQPVDARGAVYSNILVDSGAPDDAPLALLPLPSATGYSAVRVTVHSFLGSAP